MKYLLHAPVSLRAFFIIIFRESHFNFGTVPRGRIDFKFSANLVCPIVHVLDPHASTFQLCLTSPAPIILNFKNSNPTLPVNFTEFIDFTSAGSNYSTGFRVEKYEFSRKSTSGRNFGEADLIILRLADIYLMRAEAKLIKGDAAGAMADVNTVRNSRTAYAVKGTPLTGTLTKDMLFRERGFEFDSGNLCLPLRKKGFLLFVAWLLNY